MGEITKIAWTEHTFNPWIGCARVSPGCEHCYAETQAAFRTSWGVQWGVHGNRRVTSDDNWKKPLRWHKEALAAGVRARTFCASLADVFEDRPELVGPRARLFDLIARTTSLDWQLLTKRPENVLRLVPPAWREAFPKHVWMGTTVESPEYAAKRIPHLLAIPAAIRFLSCEPLLAAVDLRHWLSIPDGLDDDPHAAFEMHRAIRDGVGDGIRKLSWVIVGGESGGKARPFEIAWARSIVEQCKDAGVACFVKQLGAHALTDDGKTRLRLVDRAGTDPAEWPADLADVRAFPRSAA